MYIYIYICTLHAHVYKFSDEENEHPRLIFPFFNAAGKMYAFAGRAFGNETPKYYTLKIDESAEKIYGISIFVQDAGCVLGFCPTVVDTTVQV